MMWKEASWLGIPAKEIENKKIYQGDMNGRFALYRLRIKLEQTARLTINISANSRYRLWINGQPVLSGPCRGNLFRQHYETADVSEYLRCGANVLAVQVLLCDNMYTADWNTDPRISLFSVEAWPTGHRLAVEGCVRDPEGRTLADVTTGKADWRVWLEHTCYLIRKPGINDNMGAVTEEIDFTKALSDWKEIHFDDSRWPAGERLETVEPGNEGRFGVLKPLRMEQRPIPLLYETPGSLSQELGESVMGTADFIAVAPHEHKTLLFDGGALFNGYFRYRLDKGLGAEISFTYFEKFTRGTDEIRRDDYIHGEIGGHGQRDTIIAGGKEMVYEPFWYRTMRFLQIEITAHEEALFFYRPQYRKMGYPLNPASYIRSSIPWVGQVYKMCERTLQACMTDAYMDCPFWEQMQYPMDTRLQAMFTYVCSTDTALAEKALRDFHESMLPMGLVQGHAPSGPKQIISTFSLHYIFMLLEYYKRKGDRSLLRQYRSDVDAVLDYYDRHIGAMGLVENLGYWEFVDWQEPWKETQGCPAAVTRGPSAIINLMYGRALLDAAEICELTGRAGMAQEYRDRQKRIADRIQALCWDEERQMYREGPDYPEFTQHAQSWAVLNGLVTGGAAKKLMQRSFEEPDVLRCYFSTCYELFRACELSGCYELTRSQMEWWIRLLDQHCTTCPETPVNARSECHGWSALPMYELLSVIAGIRRESGDPRKIVVKPHMGALPDLEGGMTTEYGMIEFRYQHAEKYICYEMVLPEGMNGVLIDGSGAQRELKTGKNEIKELCATGREKGQEDDI